MVSFVNLRERAIIDRKWNPSTGRIVRSSGATVLPVYFEGYNGLFFQLAGMLHPRVRTLLLGREFIRNTKRKISLKIGHPIPYSKLNQFELRLPRHE